MDDGMKWIYLIAGAAITFINLMALDAYLTESRQPVQSTTPRPEVKIIIIQDGDTVSYSAVRVDSCIYKAH